MRNGEAIPSKSPIQSRENTERSDFAAKQTFPNKSVGVLESV